MPYQLKSFADIEYLVRLSLLRYCDILNLLGLLDLNVPLFSLLNMSQYSVCINIFHVFK